MVPNGVAGTVKSIEEGDFTITQTIAVVENENGGDSPLTLMQSWPVRKGRPYREKLPPDMPLVTGQRVIDTLFPIAKGGVAAVRVPLAPEKLLCSISWPSGPKQISSSTSDAASAAMR